jgi:hypothetical protein
MNTRSKLLIGTAALAIVQFAHLLDVLRYADNATFPAVLLDPLGLFGVGVAAAAFVAVAAKLEIGTTLALLAGTTVAVGFTLYHGIPFDLGVNNPYWDTSGSQADAIQWLTVIGAIAIGAWTAHTAWQPTKHTETALSAH